jgi:hypothetical protein
MSLTFMSDDRIKGIEEVVLTLLPIYLAARCPAKVGQLVRGNARCFMAQGDKYDRNRCWVDVYETAHFKGKLRRLFGPVRIKDLGGSVIVGPEALVEVQGQRGKRPFMMKLEANRVVPDVAKVVRGAAIHEVALKRK